jgi:Flp pilus assembly pilin Flp
MPLSFWRLLRDRCGVTGIEYALLVGAISIAIITSASIMGEQLSTFYFKEIADALTK